MTRSGPARQRHLVDVWNPSYASDAMTAHLTVLLEAAQRTKGTEDAPYVWWGKVRSPNRQQELRNLPQVLEIARELERDGDRECHLYLTDYRSLYVGLVDAITSEDVRRTDGVHVPAYYTANSLECDFWYRLLDIRRLVGDDTPVVIEKLKALRNLNYGERSVSIYGGMVDLPLVVYRQDDDRLFDPEVRGAVTEDRLWAELDAEAVGVGTMERELRENLFGDEAWLALDPAARTFIASAEKILRDQRSDPAFDYGPIVSNLAKALEVTCNAILRDRAAGSAWAGALAGLLAGHGARVTAMRPASRVCRHWAPVRGLKIPHPTRLHSSVGRAAELPTPRAEPTFMGMPDTLTPVYWTADMARRLPEDGNRYEVVYGELLVTPAPRLWHQRLVLRVASALEEYLARHPGAGVAFTSPADISWGQDVLLQPDVFVVPVEQARALDWSAVHDLLLVAEVLSPSTPRHDRFTKRRRYQEARVPLYWIVDGDARQVEVWTPGDAFPLIERDRLIWQAEGAGAPFTLPLQELFRAIE